ncbi:MAG: carboxymuconolactone decarboxylase family protein [Cyanobacteria bacterium P01_B01_bin.77]
MAYINLPPDAYPGIGGLMMAYPKTGKALANLAQQLLKEGSSLSPAERELIAARVSRANDCEFCTKAHTAAARHQVSDDDDNIVDQVVNQQDYSGLSEKMQRLIDLTLAVQQGGKFVTQTHVDQARAVGADDQAIHDTVLIAAAFCMFNRYVDGLGTATPPDDSMYEMVGQHLAQQGYAVGMLWQLLYRLLPKAVRNLFLSN